MGLRGRGPDATGAQPHPLPQAVCGGCEGPSLYPGPYLHEVLPLAGGPQGRREAAAGLLVPVLRVGQTRGWW